MTVRLRMFHFIREYISLIDDDLEDDESDLQLQGALVSSWKDDKLEPSRFALKLWEKLLHNTLCILVQGCGRRHSTIS